jgi:putative tricarboxylic transport membrane protein
VTTPSAAGSPANKDCLFGIATLALAAGYYAMAVGIPQSQLADAVGPQGLPKTYAFLLAGLSLALIVRSLPARQTARPTSEAPRDAGIDRRVLWRVAGMLLNGIVYILMVPWLGYAISVAALIAATTCFQGGGLNRRTVVVALSGAMLLWLLFVWLLRIQYPAGLWPSVS